MEPLHCLDIDELLCDYLDGALAEEQKATFETHLDACPTCQELVADCRLSMNFTERVAEVEPPRELITRILYHTPVETPVLQRLAGKSIFRRWLEPIWQPRIAMGMAMTILSFSMLGKFVMPVRQLRPADLDPAKVWRNVDDSAHRVYDRLVKYYDNLKLVYEIQTALSDIKGEDPKTESEATPETGAGKPGPAPASNQKPVVNQKQNGQ